MRCILLGTKLHVVNLVERSGKQEKPLTFTVGPGEPLPPPVAFAPGYGFNAFELRSPCIGAGEPKLLLGTKGLSFD